MNEVLHLLKKIETIESSLNNDVITHLDLKNDMNEVLHLLKKIETIESSLKNDVITHLDLKNDIPIQLFGGKNDVRK